MPDGIVLFIYKGRRNQVLCRETGDIALSEITQPQRGKHCCSFPLLGMWEEKHIKVNGNIVQEKRERERGNTLQRGGHDQNTL